MDMKVGENVKKVIKRKEIICIKNIRIAIITYNKTNYSG